MTGRVLCVDDDVHVRRFIARVLDDAGHEVVGAADVEEARQRLAEDTFEAVLCDISLPGSSGLDLLRELRESHPDVATVMVTGRDDPGIADRALDLGAYGYVTKPFAPNELLIDLSNALRRQKSEAEARERAANAVRDAHMETLRRLSRAVEYHDGATGAHIERVGEHTAAIARTLGLDEARIELLRVAAPLHDIGKIGVPASLLRKPEPLTDVERIVVQHHTDIGRELLHGSGNEVLELAAMIAWTHHERWDGAGYPGGLVGEAIPLEGRIVAVADVYDAVTSDRPYRSALSAGEARSIIAAESGKSFDPAIVAAFLR
jgi:putative two-component system response regulator